jgi:hypothetical protein
MLAHKITTVNHVISARLSYHCAFHCANLFDIRAIIPLMKEAASTSETSVHFYQTTRRNNPEDSHLHTRNAMMTTMTVVTNNTRHQTRTKRI